MSEIAKALRIARSKRKKFADGGDTLPDVGDPAIGDGGQFSEGTKLGNKAADIGSKLGYGYMKGAVEAPYSIMKNMVEGSQESMQDGIGELSPKSIQGSGDLVMQGVAQGAGVRPVGDTAGVFVGPYGALSLRNQAREAGNTAAERAMVHPVVGKDIEEEVAKLHPALRDTYRSGVQASRDEWARATLEARAAKGDFNDRDVFAKSGWSFTADGKPAKEIPDTGTKVIEHLVEKGGKGRDPKYAYSYEHPAGDFHKVYDVPSIEQDPTAAAMGARAFMQFPSKEGGGPLRIGIGTNPTKAVGPVGHEFQHAAAYREGWPAGSSPGSVPLSVQKREHFPGNKIPEYQQEALLKAEPSLKGKKLENLESTPERARTIGYLHSAGENQAFNTQLRRRQSFRYLSHPQDTEAVPRAFQDIEPFHKAGGGGVGGNFNPERGSAFGLAKEGLIKSSVPGRTDKLNLNVPTGSYVIPADIPSAIGQGNSDAGSSILNKMFSKGPYGMNLGKSKGPRVGIRHSSLHPMHFAKGGAVNPTTPIVAAGGEYLIHPDTIAALGNGDISLGHQILDSFVKHIRAKHIKTLRKLPGPKGSK